ncbi:UNVERIFIED_CONTAM: hypothetical protein FKN15_057195 [Acipenser sinensis]
MAATEATDYLHGSRLSKWNITRRYSFAMATKTLVFRSQEEHTDQRFQSLRTASKTTKKKFKSSEEDVVGQDSFPFVSPEVLSVKEFLNLDSAAAKKSCEEDVVGQDSFPFVSPEVLSVKEFLNLDSAAAKKSCEGDVVGQDSFPFVSPEVLSVKEFLNLDSAAAKKSWAVEKQTAVTEEQLEMEKRTLFGNEMEKLEVEVIETNKVLRGRADHNARRKRAEEKSLQLQKTFEERERRTPEVLFPLRHHTVWEGMGVKLSCTFQGCPKPEIKWYKDGVLLQSSSHPGKYRIQSRFGHNTLEISRCTIADSAEYKVVATNKLGEAFSFATVLVNSYQGVQSGYDSTKSTILVSEMEADFDQTLQPSFPREGGSLTLSCEFSSDLLTYQRALLWFKDGVPLPESQRRQLHTGSRSASLTITQVYKEDEGLYSIHLPTLTGVKEQSAYVFVRDAAAAVTGAPGSPLDVECSDINKDYVFLTWKPPSADGGSPVVGYFIDRLDIGSGQWVQCNDAPHNICRFPVVGLREGGIYQFRVRAVNKAGVGRPSKKTEAVTMVDPSEAGRVMGDILIPLPPTDAHVSEVSGACVVLSWTEPDPRGREPLTYYVEKVLSAVNNGMLFGFSPSKPFSPSAAPSTPSSIALLSCGKSEMVIGWRAPKWNGGDVIQGYFLDQVDVSESVWHEVNVKPIATQVFKVGNVKEDHLYQFRATAMNCVGVGKASEPSDPFLCKEWTMPEPGPPYGLLYREVRRKSLVLLWEPPVYTGQSPVTGYLVDICEVGSDEWKAVTEEPTSNTFLKFPGLEAGRSYMFRVFAVNAAGVGEPSLPSEEVKAETKPGMKDVEIGVDEDGFIFLEFQTPEWNESSEFLWTKNYSKAIDQGRIRIESKDDRSRLILTNPSEQDLGLYTVAMSDIDDISSSYTFTDKELERLLELSWEIRNPLIALKSNWAVEVSEKGDVRLWLQVEKLSSAAELKLIFNNKEIASTATHKINFDRATGIVEVLIDNFSEVDKGSYTAQLRDGRAKNQFTFVLIDDNFKQALAQSEFKRRDWKRKAGPHFLEFLTWKVTEDCELHFSCKVTNMKKETSLKWFKDGVEVTGVEYNPQTGISTLVVTQVTNMKKETSLKWFKDGVEVTGVEYNPQTGISMLVVTQVTKKEEGIYKVVLCDERGEDTSVIELVDEAFDDALIEYQRLRQADIADKNRARVTKGLPDVVAIMEDKSLCLTCFTSGDPSPEVFWLKNDREIVTGDQYNITKDNVGSTITINTVTTEDSGKYSVFARNKHGSETVSVTVSVYRHGETPKQGEVLI